MRTPPRPPLLFLSWESPWPAHSGAALRTLGLLSELGRRYSVDLVVLTRRELSDETLAHLSDLAQKRDPAPTARRFDLRQIARPPLDRRPPLSLSQCAQLEGSLAGAPAVRRKIKGFPGVVFTSIGHWGTLIRDRPSSNWVLNQCDADVEFWKVYALQNPNPLARWAARLNYLLARIHYPRVYAHAWAASSPSAKRIRRGTLSLAPLARVEVIENGIDLFNLCPCSHARIGPPRLLFTGTSTARNMTALRRLVNNVLPLVLVSEMPGAELLVEATSAPRPRSGSREFPPCASRAASTTCGRSSTKATSFWPRSKRPTARSSRSRRRWPWEWPSSRLRRALGIFAGRRGLGPRRPRRPPIRIPGRRPASEPRRTGTYRAAARDVALRTIDWAVLRESYSASSMRRAPGM